MRPADALIPLALLLAVPGVRAQAPEEPVELIIATWGGAYEAAQEKALFEPFTQQTGIAIRTLPYAGGADILERSPDLVDMSMSQAMAACEDGRLRPLDHGDLPPGADGTPATRDFIAGAHRRCSLTHTLYAMVVAYDTRAFPGRKPSGVADLFNIEDFPGRRALNPDPDANLEWALMSHGVPRREIYHLLSTERGLDLAFSSLEKLRGDVVWWRDAQRPVELLENGEAVMASGYNGRFFNARLDGPSPIEIIWDGQLQEHQTWVIPADAARPEQAWQFIRFATGTEPLRDLAERIPYGPARRSAARQVGRHPEHDIDMRVHIPNHPYNSASAITKDVSWYARTLARIRDRFERWRERAGSQ